MKKTVDDIKKLVELSKKSKEKLDSMKIVGPCDDGYMDLVHARVAVKDAVLKIARGGYPILADIVGNKVGVIVKKDFAGYH